MVTLFHWMFLHYNNTVPMFIVINYMLYYESTQNTLYTQ